MIDPKEIYIGAHYYNGGYVERVIGRVTAIHGSIYRPEEMTVGLIYDMPLDEDNDPYEHTVAINLEPIPITNEILKEIGFDLYGGEGFNYRDGGVLDTGEYFIWVEPVEYHYWGCQITERFGLKDDVLECSGISSLHQLENIVYEITETELIK